MFSAPKVNKLLPATAKKAASSYLVTLIKIIPPSDSLLAPKNRQIGPQGISDEEMEKYIARQLKEDKDAEMKAQKVAKENNANILLLSKEEAEENFDALFIPVVAVSLAPEPPETEADAEEELEASSFIDRRPGG